jgi:pSer/pThr/pTyr-binding forkhead associated (FHA) protein
MPIGSTLASSRKDAGPSTVVLQSADLGASPGPGRLSPDAIPETRSLVIPQGQTIKVSVISGPSQGQQFEMSRPLMTIGRLGGEADFQIEDPEVSRLHCALEVRRDSILLHDLGSKNGTFLEDSRVLGVRLEKVSRFRIGSSCLQVDVLREDDPQRER